MRRENRELWSTFAEALDPAENLHYVNSEVKLMRKKIFLILFAAGLLACANMRVSWRVSVEGGELPGTFSGRELRRCGIVSSAAVDEIARGTSQPAGCTALPVLSLRGADGDPGELSDALITSAPGVARGCEIYSCGNFCGIVEDPAEFQNEAGLLSFVAYRPVYTFYGRASDCAAVYRAVCGQAGKFT